MEKLFDKYSQVVSKVKKLQNDISNAEIQINQLTSEVTGSIASRINNLEGQLLKIDEYLLKIKGFQELAKRNLDSLNILTIDAPPGYRVNLNRLRNWAMMIDPQSSNDPYAQRVYIVSKCDEHFLEQKKIEFSERINDLKSDTSIERNNQIVELKCEIERLIEQQKKYASSEDVITFSKEVIQENLKYWYKSAPEKFPNNEKAPETVSPGAFAVPFPCDKSQNEWLKNLFSDFFDADGSRILLPFEINNNMEYVISVTCSPSRRKRLDRGLQNFLLYNINENPAFYRKIFLIDAVRYNSSSLGSLRQLENSFALSQIPRNPEQLTNLLEEIVSSFADFDEILDAYDSVSEYNENCKEIERLPYTTMVLFGWPNAFTGHDKELIQRIMTCYERYGISIISVEYKTPGKKNSYDRTEMPEYAMQNAIFINMTNSETTIAFSDEEPHPFTWYSFNEELTQSYIDSVLSHAKKTNIIGNEYSRRYVLDQIPNYQREYKTIELPFGIDGKDQAHSLSFENENFATYLVGASRSGKSTLLHTLIASLIKNYHPDNVELWLADFKQLEFKRYMKHLPPHVKYVLLDESQELVFDLIDRLNNEMLKRQRLFARLGVQRIDQVNPVMLEEPLPVIFVILDEFSIMSQSIAEEPAYKLKLQNVLAKGAALGIKFLFSSQTFTTGVAGLTSTARAQIQQRIAMKGSKEEISETLELSANLRTEQVKNWMDALPPHYALVKYRLGADTLPQVKRYLVMYFEDYSVRDQMIELINQNMYPVNQYTPTDLHSYVNKSPVLVDGNTFDSFNCDLFLSSAKEFSKNQEELRLSFGTPRLMSKMKNAVLSQETRENILLIGRSSEEACSASVILSVIKSARLQSTPVQIWAYNKNHLYQTYKKAFDGSGVQFIEGMDGICTAIKELKQKILQKKASKVLIVLIGMDRICMDFEYMVDQKKDNFSPTIEYRSNLKESSAVVSTEEDELKRKYTFEFTNFFKPYSEDAKRKGKSREEIKVLRREMEKEFRKKYDNSQTYVSPNNSIISDNEMKKSNSQIEVQSDEYNALEDFKFVTKQGSRLGYHFMLNLNSFADLKSCGLKIDNFRYRMAFQISAEDSREMFNNRIASKLPEHICQFDDTLERYSFRPYIHSGIGWDGWDVDENGNIINPYSDLSE